MSDKGEREGDSYRSPRQQEAAMRAWAESNGVEVGLVELDENVKGSTKMSKRKLGKLLDRAEAGESDGILTYRINRFGRNMAETVAAVSKLKEVGARLVSVSPDSYYDTNQPGGQVMLGLFAGLAEQQLDERRENWKAATAEAVEEGIHIACHAPMGYLRADQVDPRHDQRGRLIRDGRLVVDLVVAPAIHTAFEMRAREESLQKIATYLRETLDRKLAKSTVSAILKNRAYLGEARGPHGAVKTGAHDPIVTPELFAAAQRPGRTHARDGSLAAQSSLAGIITCAACGRRLQIMGRRNGKGERVASYVCTAKYNGDDCDAPAIGDVARVDDYVLWLLQQNEEEVIEGAGLAETEYLQAREALRTAEEELALYVEDPTLATELGHEMWRRGMTVRATAVETARAELWDLEDPGLPEDAKIVTLDGKPHIYTVWGDDPAADRRTLRKFIERVTLAKCDHRRGHQPIAERIEVRWAGATAEAAR